MERKRIDAKRRSPAGAAVMRTSVTDALTQALFEVWAQTGYGALSLEAVARRAGAGKAALYRRWPSKLAMVCDRVEHVGLALALSPDTGTFRGDLRTALGALCHLLQHPLVRCILPDLHAEMNRSSELAKLLRGRLQTERRERGTSIVRRAVARGEIPAHTDPEMFNDTFGMLYWRVVVTAGRVDDDYLDALTDFLCAAVGPPEPASC
jgi:AcrR family transcriptional regulator